jgi:predicted CopG family antitoxin
MATKTISINEDTYKRLREAKRKGESFGDVIDRMMKNAKIDLEDYFGSLKDDDILDEIDKVSSQIRNSSRLRI